MGYTPPQPAQTVLPVNVPFAWNDPDLLTGKTIYVAEAGDIIAAESMIATYQFFDGTTPTLTVLVDGEPLNSVSSVISGNSAPDIPAFDANNLGLLYNPNAFLQGTAFYFIKAGTLVLLLDDGAGGDPHNTQGRGEVRLIIIKRANAQPQRPTYAITDANASQQWFKLAGNHVPDFTLNDPSTGVGFSVVGSTANDGRYTATDGNTHNISAIDQLTNTVTLGALSHATLRLPPGANTTIASSTGNNGIYTVATSDDATHSFTTVEPLPDPTADGHVTLPAAVYLSGEVKTLVWVLGSAIADDTGDGTIEL